MAEIKSNVELRMNNNTNNNGGIQNKKFREGLCDRCLYGSGVRPEVCSQCALNPKYINCFVEV